MNNENTPWGGSILGRIHNERPWNVLSFRPWNVLSFVEHIQVNINNIREEKLLVILLVYHP